MTAPARVPRNLIEVAALIAAGELAALADELLEINRRTAGRWGHDGKLVARLLIGAPPEVRAGLMRELVTRADVAGDGVDDVLGLLLRHHGRDLPADVATAVLVRAVRGAHGVLFGQVVPVARRLAARGEPLPVEVIAALRRTAIACPSPKGELHHLVASLSEPVLNPGEDWADRVLADLPGLGGGWPALLMHARTATATRPSVAWERRARVLLDTVGAASARHAVIGWLTSVGARRAEDGFDPFNAVALRGLSWLLALTPAHPDSARALGGLVETALRKVPGIGPRGPKVANAAAYALAKMDGEALAQLARLAARVTYQPTLKEINAALDARAAAAGLSRAEIEELAIPTYGLTKLGHRVVRYGDTTAELTVNGGRAVLAWRGPAGKPVKAPPAGVRRDFAAELAALKAVAKDIDKLLTALSDRLDRLFLARRTWPYAAWRARYLDHPLAGTLARRLVWLVDDVPCGFADGALRTLEDTPVTPVADAPVAIWHPVGRTVPEVRAWREWLHRHGITQPFKQAHRETYPLTVAEEHTEVYSNRYAAHVLRQHQFNALASVRGWRNTLRLMVDDEYPPAVRELPEWGLRAEFWIEGVGEDWARDVTETGTYLRVVTDQVRFYPLSSPPHAAHAGGGGYEQRVPAGGTGVRPLPLAQIPPLVFSEVMRDIDLFVGVASVGNDPTWQDGGPEGRFREYWEAYSFGELSATAQTRRDLLARLLPRLAVGKRCTLDGRFLLVRGDLHTYKIHLGSGSILMSPNDEYLCIVPEQHSDAGNGGLFLPFEGDRVLAVILSKAMMLAHDTRITDPSITRQIRR